MAKVLKEAAPAPAFDVERFRLRAFVDRLAQHGEVETHDGPVALGDLARHLDSNAKAVRFRRAGPEAAELVGNVMGSRKRLAMAFDATPEALRAEIVRRLGVDQPVVEIGSGAPVHEIVWTGDDADLTRLPVHLQHGMDGGPYISAGIDYAIDEANGWTNTGCRRLMLRGRREAGVDLTAPTDLKAIYEARVRKGERLAVSYVVGSHPIDHVAATMRLPGDELALLARLRGAPLPVVRCRTNDVRVPADAEMVIEGYLDERGHVEAEGPYGEFLGYYGVVKRNPVFHVTAITMRRDALFQTSTIGARLLGRTDTAQLNAIRADVTVWKALESAVREPVAVYATPASGGSFNVRVSLRQRVPGEARNAIAAVMGCLGNIKNVFVVDLDIDVFSDEQMDWALATRFQADRDIVVADGFRTVPLDPSLGGSRVGAKAGFDLTLPFAATRPLEHTRPAPPEYGAKRFASVAEALADGPKSFGELMSVLGSRDGREIVRALDTIRSEGRLARLGEGQYALGDKAG